MERAVVWVVKTEEQEGRRWGAGWRWRAAARAVRGWAALVCVSTVCLGAGSLLHAQAGFSATTVGTSSSTQNVTVTVAQAGTVATVEVLTLGAPSLDYQQMGTDTCVGNTFTAAQTCSVPVVFNPLYPGPRAGAIVLVSSTNTVLATQYLSGVGNGALGVFIPGTASTFAGNGDFTSLGDGGLAIHAGLKLPFGVVVDGVGNAYIADSGEYRIRRVDAVTQDISTYAGNGTESYTGDGGAATSATMGTPEGLAIDGAGNLYFADSTEHVVRRIDGLTHIITTAAGTGTHGSTGDGGAASSALLYAPYGVALDAAGNLFIADTANARIRRVDAVTQIITTVAGNGTVSGTLGDGGLATAASLNQPYGVAFDPAGNMYIADSGNNRVRRVDAMTGIITTVAGNGTQGFMGDGGDPTLAELYFPSSVAFDPAGNMYIADTQNNRIRKIENGNIYTITGNGNGKYGGDGGSALLAGIYGPYFVYLDSTGSLYIGDYFDNRVREVPSNVVTLTYTPTPTLRVGQTSMPQSQGIENDGNASLMFSMITPDANAAIDATSTSCGTTASISVGSGCLIGAEFAPSMVGNPITGNIVLTGSPVAELSDTPMKIKVVGQALALTSTNVTLSAVPPSPSTYGTSVSFIATVNTGTGVPTGKVTFMDGATTLGMGTLAAAGSTSANTTYATTLLQVGPHSITAVYPGDGTHGSNTSPAVAYTIQSTTSTALVASPTSAAVNSPVTLTATVTQTSAGTPLPNTSPGGNLYFYYDGSTYLGAGTQQPNGTWTYSATSLSVGTHTLTAAYQGDTYNKASTSSAVTETITKQATSTALGTSLSPSIYGNAVTFTATVTVTGSGTPTGGITFYDSATALNSQPILLDVNGKATFSTSALTAGTHSITAKYAGDLNDASSTSSALSQVVQQATTSDTLTSSTTPAIAGKSITLTATIADTTGAGVPSGTVLFKDGSTTLGSAVALDGTGKATLSATLSPQGVHALTSTYSGDTNHAGSTGTLSLNVVQATTSVTISSSLNPSTLGQSVTFTITVSGNGGVPGGTVALAADGTGLGNQSTALTNGTATVTSSALTAGTHAMTAAYSGDTNDAASTTASALTQTVNAKVASTTVLTTGANPSIAGKNLSLTATVTTTNGTPTGAVSFLDGSTALGSGTLNGSGQATLATAALSPGPHSLTAVYAGDSTHATSTSSPVTETITQATTTTVLAAAPNPAVVTHTVTLTATVSGSGGTPTGTVTFNAGSTALATVSLANGVATYATGSLPIGTDSLAATYNGDTDDGTSQATGTVTIQKASPTLALVSGPEPSLVGQSVTLTATAANTAATATGTVTFLDGANSVGTAPLNQQNVATLSLTSLGLGTHAITASYSGDADNAGAVSQGVTQTVQQTTTTLLTATPNPSLAGTAVALSAAVLGANGSAPASGTVTFKDGATTLGTSALASGTATLSLTSLAPGAHTLTAVYSGDTLDTGSTSPAVNESVTAAGTNTVLTGSGSPAFFGATVTFTAQVTGNGAAPSGSVTFSDGAQALGKVTLGAGGQAVFSTNALAAGTHAITAAYGGDANNQPSTSATLAQVIVARTTTTLAAAPASAIATTAVTLTAQVNSNAGTHPGGMVTFNDGTTSLGAASLDQNGTATLPVSTLVAGSHSLSAAYTGDALDAGSTSAAVMETIQPIPTSTHLGLSAATVAAGQPVTMLAIVSSGYSAPFVGTMTFTAGTTVLGQATPDSSGSATLNTPLALGKYSIVASYSGDAFNAPSTSAAVPLTVSNSGGPTDDFKMTLAPTALTMATKQNSTVTLTIGSSGGFADTIGLGCASLPKLVTCTFSKDIVALAANGTATVQLTVDTASPLTSGGVASNTRADRKLPIALGLLLPGTALLAWASRRRRWARFLVWLLIATAAGTTFSLSGCGGLSSNGAAPGTYTFQVTAYGNTTGVQHSVDLSLKVTQ